MNGNSTKETPESMRATIKEALAAKGNIATINIKNAKDGSSLLHTAAIIGNEMLVRTLLDVRHTRCYLCLDQLMH